ncbi:flagellar assembly peptidoglycan hydrolase FlgJ [Cupriavidus respiraculi]|uniref:Peptidoglycan hydrolase FlgJ n=1 Tax=Cupriavidus respiraculi TaxID=195930 RepID=A0ABM8XHB0_9BURK|nr:flagellar assembly peptidoglycan hydrolase FlgJ [Cupriavidus respiraculi]MBY4948543.1 flagellar assembly peptidoglycan hydrolase FlgJ [Cupriavidus respiraculi]CAG9179553.1 Peptidoglycan hydrolase FlgJ [Cupriavidus respiraculi]
MSRNLSAQADVSQRFALDTQGFEMLKQSARADGGGEALKAAAKQFEAVFTHMMLKSMRDATPQDGIFDNEQTKLYMSMLDQQMSQHLSSRGIGLADVMVQQLARASGMQVPGQVQGKPATPMDAAAASVAGLLDSRGATEAGGEFSETPRAGTVVLGSNWNPTAGLRQYQAQETGAWQGNQIAVPEDAPPHVTAFVSRMSAPAAAASQATGVPARLILGQAALESGWGKREITHPDGSTTHNVFGIKAGANWKGPTAEITTTEYIDGQPQKVRARFRAYGSYEEAFHDYARLLANNPRYAPVLSAGSADEAARGLQRAGYATDPEYGEKLVRIMRKVST